MSRIIRRRASKIGFVTTMPVKNGEARVTIVVLTASKATRAQEAGIRHVVEDELKNLNGIEFEDLVKELLFGSFANEIFKKAKKICLLKKVIAEKATFIEAK
jgi:ribosomal protein S3AE